MIKFSNMTLQEFINLNRDEIPEEVLEYFDELLITVHNLRIDNHHMQHELDKASIVY